MNDKLEKFMLDHRDEFDVYEPSPDVWKKIEKDMHKKRSINWYRIMWKAASVVIIFALSFLATEYLHRNTKISEKQEAGIDKMVDQIPELAEAKAYYTSMVNSKLREIEPMLEQNPELNKDIMNDLSELDSIYIDLKKDLKDNIANREIIEAMIQNYRLKLEILEELQMELLNEENNEDYENYGYEI